MPRRRENTACRRMPSAGRKRPARRGFAVLLVLGLISMTLAVSYAVLRTQAAGLKAGVNVGQRLDARQAAYSGLSTALRKMSQSDWAGADTVLTGTVGPDATFAASFTTGDAELTSGDSQAAEWPYRMTITVTGIATNTAVSPVPATYRVEAVARLVPRSTTTNPAVWTSSSPYVVYQTSTDDVTVQLPVRINGAIRFQSQLTFCPTYPSTNSSRNQYLSDLNSMRSNGYADHRPFTGPISMPLNDTPGSTRNLLTGNLGITLTNMAVSTASGWSHPGTVTTYKLYTGGRSYTAVSLGSSVSGTTLVADRQTNPLGLFVRSGDVTLGNNTTIRGTILSTGDVRFGGTSVTVEPLSLPPLEGSSAAVQLPVIVAGDDVEVNDGTRATVRGNVTVFDDFNILAGSDATQFSLQGRLITRDFDVNGRTEWNVGSTWWSLLFNWWDEQDHRSDGVRYFPVYCQAWGLAYTPVLTFNPATDSVTQQWFTAGSPVYIGHPADPGLRWSILRRREYP
jgi:hypothetical protein